VKAITVLGPVDENDLGVTLMHEHLLFDFRCYWEEPPSPCDVELADAKIDMPLLGKCRYNPFLFKDNLVHGDIELTLKELEDCLAWGVKTVVDATNISVGRDSMALQRISRLTGLNIIMGTGFYIDKALNDRFLKRSVGNIADELACDVLEGRGGVKAGIIGEIGTSSPITAKEEKSLRAAARAQSQTSAPLMIHLDGWAKEGHRVLDVVEEEGADINRTILCHMNPCWKDFDYLVTLAERGAYLEFDMMGMNYLFPPNKLCPDDYSVLATVSRLCKGGFRDRVLMSQDVFLKSMFKAYGGLGYTHIFDNLEPLFVELGISQEDTRAIFVENPKRILPFWEDK